MERERTFEQLHGQYQQKVLNFIRRRISSEETAQELTADVFRIAWQKYSEIPETSLPWLLSVARNVIGNAYQARQRAQELQERLIEAERAKARNGLDPQPRGRAEALNLLRDKEREILILAYWDDLSIRDIAIVLGCSESAASVRLYRARKAFAYALSRGNKTQGEH
ncbi:RNA polymerase sigma factor [Psychromicrobium lacuslunae]|nr:sigma-70 family RNA polymerase sigma factor [Psychromicrobium lacuslunae]